MKDNEYLTFMTRLKHAWKEKKKGWKNEALKETALYTLAKNDDEMVSAFSGNSWQVILLL